MGLLSTFETQPITPALRNQILGQIASAWRTTGLVLTPNDMTLAIALLAEAVTALEATPPSPGTVPAAAAVPKP